MSTSWTATELQETMWNRQPGTNAMKMISFEGGFHGRSMGALSLTRSKAIHKLDIPASALILVLLVLMGYPFLSRLFVQ